MPTKWPAASANSRISSASSLPIAASTRARTPWSAPGRTCWRPIEIYRGRPIFYSLGDFILQLENIARAPAEMYTGQGLRGNEGLDELFTARSQGGKRGLYYNRTMFEAVVPYWEACDGEVTRLELLAVELNFDKPRSTGGWPRPAGTAAFSSGWRA